jgi:lipopolysaccharide transport system permease protein
VVGNAGIVKNIAFKAELLPLVGVLIGLVPLLVALTLLIVLKTAAGEPPNVALLALVPVIVLQWVFVSGIGLFLAALNVFVRDTALVLPNVLTLLLFASPIFYPLSAYPAPLQRVLAFNPFYVLSECYRAPIIEGAFPTGWMLAYLAAVSGICFVSGLWWFRRLKSFFDTRL